jgi:glycosyltransferase involved in cell wall biosynthesis
VKIAMVSEHASPLAALGGVDAGGQNVHVANLARSLARSGHEVTVYTRRDDVRLPAQVPLDSRVTVVHVTAGPATPLPKDELLQYMGVMAQNMRADLQRRRPHIIHAHFWMSGVAAMGLARSLRLPTAITFHALGSVKRRQQGDRDTSPPERIAVERALVRAADRILATSNEEIFELVRLGAKRPAIALVPCGVDTAQFRPDGPVAVRDSALSFRVVVVSRLVERKGIGNVIAALARVPDTELVIAGGPERRRLQGDPEAGRLAALATEHGVRDRVTFLGRIERTDVPALLRSADVVACTPWYEPFGMVALEAMACGVPVVATAVGGLVDSVLDGVTGALVPPRDVDRLADELRTLLEDPARRARLGRAGVQRARSRYDWATVAHDTVRAYALASRSTAARVRRVG